MDAELREYAVHRTLADPVFRIRLYCIRLTDADIAFTSFLGVLTWLIVQWLGYSKQKIWGLTLDPFAGFFVAGLLILLVSALHKFRPEGDILQIVRGLSQPKLLAPRTYAGDRTWRPATFIRRGFIPFDHRRRMWERKDWDPR